MFRQSRQREALIEELPDTPSASPQASQTTELLQEARNGTAEARRALATANGAHAVAVETADRLQQQTKQLEDIASTVDDTRDHLDSAEVTIEKLTRPIWRRRVGKRDGRNSAGGDVARIQERLYNFGGLRTKSEKKDKKMREVVDVTSVVESYDEFDATVRSELVAQDDLLNDTSVIVSQLRELAVGIGEELEKEAEIVEGIDAVEVTGRIRVNNRKLRSRLKLK